jgi:hypothetical protein
MKPSAPLQLRLFCGLGLEVIADPACLNSETYRHDEYPLWVISRQFSPIHVNGGYRGYSGRKAQIYATGSVTATGSRSLGRVRHCEEKPDISYTVGPT